jgi:hypothetical protein
MRWLAALLLLLTASCAPAPRIAIDLRALDGVPVLPLQTDTGVSSALLLEDGTVLTCSHGIPRGHETGELCLGGFWTRYHVAMSGDNLATHWDVWKGKVPDGMHGDWSHVTLTPAVRPSDFFHPPFPVTPSPRPPQPGETVYVVGYTIEPDPNGTPEAPHHAVRHWVPLIVTPPPTRSLAETAEPVVWVRTGPEEDLPELPPPASPQGGRPGAFLARGFSGTPLLRPIASADGRPAFEACGVLVAADREDDADRGHFGLAVPIPAAYFAGR